MKHLRAVDNDPNPNNDQPRWGIPDGRVYINGARSKFTQRHYEAIAAQLACRLLDERAVFVVKDGPTFQAIVLALANLFELDNPNFRRDKFLKACGL